MFTRQLFEVLCNSARHRECRATSTLGFGLEKSSPCHSERRTPIRWSDRNAKSGNLLFANLFRRTLLRLFRLELLSHPFLERLHVLFAAQEVVNQGIC